MISSFLDVISIGVGAFAVVAYTIISIPKKQTPVFSDIASVFFTTATLVPGIFLCKWAIDISLEKSEIIAVSPMFLFFGGVALIYNSVDGLCKLFKALQNSVQPNENKPNADKSMTNQKGSKSSIKKVP